MNQTLSSQQQSNIPKREPLPGVVLIVIVIGSLFMNMLVVGILSLSMMIREEVIENEKVVEINPGTLPSGWEEETDVDEIQGESTKQPVYVGEHAECATEIAYVPDFATRKYYENEKEAFEERLERSWAEDIVKIRESGDLELADVYEKSISGYKAALRSYEDYQNYVAVKRTRANYLCVEEFGIKIELPETVVSVEYRVDTIRPSRPGELEIVGIRRSGYGNFNLRSYGVIDMKQVSTRYDLGILEWAPLSWLGKKDGCTIGQSEYCYESGAKRAALVYDDGDFGLFTNLQSVNNVEKLIPDLTSDQANRLRLAVDAVGTLLETKENYSAL